MGKGDDPCGSATEAVTSLSGRGTRNREIMEIRDAAVRAQKRLKKDFVKGIFFGGEEGFHYQVDLLEKAKKGELRYTDTGQPFEIFVNLETSNGVPTKAVINLAKDIARKRGWPETEVFFRDPGNQENMSGASLSAYSCSINGASHMTRDQLLYTILHENAHGRSKRMKDQYPHCEIMNTAVGGYCLKEALTDMLADDALKQIGCSLEKIDQNQQDENAKEIMQNGILAVRAAEKLLQQAGVSLEEIDNLSESDAQMRIAERLAVSPKELSNLFEEMLIAEGRFKDRDEIQSVQRMLDEANEGEE
jgi:hypothetical protein